MTGKERITNILQRKPVDRIGIYEHYWEDTLAGWSGKGHLKEDQDLNDHFGHDMQRNYFYFNMTADLDFVPEILEETEETILTRDGNGALLRRHKLHDTTPEHVDFLVKDRAAWEEYIKPLLMPEPRRINFEEYRRQKLAAAAAGRFFCWSGPNVFELMHPVAGHEYMLMGMALDPDWIRDMVKTYSELTINLMEILFEQEGYPDGIWFYEDMGYKEHPFMSLNMYLELIQPGHFRTIGYAKSKGLPVIMHSCGFIEPLLPGMIEAGIDCLQVLEVKAGMDPLRVHRDYGHCLSLMGGIDVRVLYSNNKELIDRELESKIPIMKKGFGFVLHSDHSIPNNVEYDTYGYFLERGIELGSY